MDEFEIISKDVMGRIGRLKTRSGTIETPTMMPVINPNLIIPNEMRKYGAEMIITNAYIIYRNDNLREKAIEEGVHQLLHWEGPIMTDSGAYQHFEYRDVGISNAEIVEFQSKIGSDICVPLDIPTHPDAEKEKAESELEETLRRLREARDIIHNVMLAGPIQGSIFSDLREKSVKKTVEIGFEIYSIGGLVPLLESYSYGKLVDIILDCKRSLPSKSPVHLFGVGHPMFFVLAVALGCDLFDSAAYAIYAKNGRYLTANKTYITDKLMYLPCSCPVCSSHTTEELKGDERLVAEHNLYVTFEEIRLIKQSIRDKNLWELVERRCRAHPSLLNGLKKMVEQTDLIERYDPATKSSFFYLGPTSAHRSEVLHYSKRLERFTLSGKVLVTTSKTDTPNYDNYDQVFLLKPPFGPYPLELEGTYPISQSEVYLDDEAKTVALQNVLKLMIFNKDVEFFFMYDDNWEHELIKEIGKHAKVQCIEDVLISRSDFTTSSTSS
jgi:7-cyano-7-deazaguanine tRNA-ribosyltransferase